MIVPIRAKAGFLVLTSPFTTYPLELERYDGAVWASYDPTDGTHTPCGDSYEEALTWTVAAITCRWWNVVHAPEGARC